MGRVIDLFITYRFIRLLTTPFEKQKAFELGIIDENGYRTDKKIETPDEKSSYTILHKLVFNIKRIFSKVPILKTKLGTYAAALFLLKDTFKEEAEFEKIEKFLMEEILKNPEILLDNDIHEEFFGDSSLPEDKKYFLSTEVLLEDKESFGNPGDQIIFEDYTPVDNILGMNIYKGIHVPTNQTVYVSKDNF